MQQSERKLAVRYHVDVQPPILWSKSKTLNQKLGKSLERLLIPVYMYP